MMKRSVFKNAPSVSCDRSTASRDRLMSVMAILFARDIGALCFFGADLRLTNAQPMLPR
jgi:hypothetical protein